MMMPFFGEPLVKEPRIMELKVPLVRVVWLRGNQLMMIRNKGDFSEKSSCLPFSRDIFHDQYEDRRGCVEQIDGVLLLIILFLSCFNKRESPLAYYSQILHL